jgi:hypothetical protein
MLKAFKSTAQTEACLSDSEDPTQLFLEQGLSKVRQAVALWAVADGNSTSSFEDLEAAKHRYDVLHSFLVWLCQEERNSTLPHRLSQEREGDLPLVLALGHRLRSLVNQTLSRASTKQSADIKRSSVVTMVAI